MDFELITIVIICYIYINIYNMLKKYIFLYVNDIKYNKK